MNEEYPVDGLPSIISQGLCPSQSVWNSIMFLADRTLSYVPLKALTSSERLRPEEAEPLTPELFIAQALKTAPVWSSVLFFIDSVITLIGCC